MPGFAALHPELISFLNGTIAPLLRDSSRIYEWLTVKRGLLATTYLGSGGRLGPYQATRYRQDLGLQVLKVREWVTAEGAALAESNLGSAVDPDMFAAGIVAVIKSMTGC